MRAGLDSIRPMRYDNQVSQTRDTLRLPAIHLFRACTGFDGDFEVWEAIRRLRSCAKSRKLNINADEGNFAIAA